jgi:hypothetical protein
MLETLRIGLSGSRLETLGDYRLRDRTLTVLSLKQSICGGVLVTLKMTERA